METKLIRADGQIKVISPYNATFVKKIKMLHGKFDYSDKSWAVSEEYEEQLLALLDEIYGYTEGASETVKVRYRAVNFQNQDEIIIGGLSQARRASRDGTVKLSANTIFVSGDEFPSSGGSTKYPRIDAEESTILQSTIPAAIYDRLSDDEKSMLTILEEGADDRRKKLEDRKAELLLMLQEVESELMEL